MAEENPQEVLLDQKRTVVSVANLRWANAEHTLLDADVLFQELAPLGPVPFTALADADTSHGVEIWTKANAGDYGVIAEYVAPPVQIPDRVTANQFGKQLATMGLLDQVQTWVSQQDAATQWSFNRSATFVRDDPMMQAGFTALGFTTQQIDAFFLAASQLD